MKHEPPSSITAERAVVADPRTLRLLQGPIVATLLRMAWPNILVMLAQASTGLIETWWVSKLGTAALTGMAVVFPGFMMTQMLSAGALGGGISSAIARALGGGRKADAEGLVMHAIAINIALGMIASLLFLVFGRTLYGAMGAEGPSLDAAMTYSNIVFGGNVLVWLGNGFASIIRGTGNMLIPSLAVLIGVVLLIPLSPLLIFGFGAIPGFGIAGGGMAVIATTLLTGGILCGYIGFGYCLVGFRRVRPRLDLFVEITRVAAVAALTTLQTSFTVMLTTALVGRAGGPDAVAGYGTGTRLEYLLVPLTFGFGAPLVALVGTNIGAGQNTRALRIGLIGGALSFVLAETVGLAAAIWPQHWLGLFGTDPEMMATGIAYLHAVGPAYGFFGLGLALYFASQGAGRLLWPMLSGSVRLVIAIAGSWLALSLTGSLVWMFAALAAALVAYGILITISVVAGAWFTPRRV